ncbi:hypothetical protein NLK61_25725 [Pseudomonas fuscovaginae UPB0736]|uniref:Uncharacterized protein n=1 Tax=Pseudomonas asplenii TaxID=53407 RepID=A0A1H1XJN0_9PSED|nr:MULTISPECIES: hypothetical protein [Pseudomonas]UUQ64564.1 hypothetical protein NLK61_25725 [Pseudomonas fuscovaginae UPB0736]UZE26949.1 hypothetical protein LOY63_16285 [Pseudomonas asplenii]SDT09410.1 hypothetical protein SAMN05216598_3938 [Pseudomonas asplenii]SEI21586.1 hypothetical protein SAMN05216581_4547 [Pseudomonas fuscovaginae]
MNINSTLSNTYNLSNLNKSKPQIQEKPNFSIETPAETNNNSDKISISAAGANMSDAMDPPIPVGAMPGWWGEFAILLTLPSERGYQELRPLSENEKFSNISSGERNEYFALLQSHMSDLYERNGLIDDDSKYAALNSRSTNERLHQEFLEGIRNDPRMSELVSRLGIALS